MNNIHILVLDDSADDRKLIEMELEKADFNVTVSHASTGTEFEKHIAGSLPDAVVSDFEIPGYHIDEARSRLQEHNFCGPFLLVTGALIDQQAIDLLVGKKIDDYILKHRLSRLVPALERELRRNRLEQDIRLKNKELERLSRVAKFTHNGVIITNADGLITWVNEAYEKMTGYSMEESLGKKPGNLLQGDGTDPATVRRISKKLKQKVPFSQEILNYTKSGSPYWINLDITPILDDVGGVKEFIAIQEEITEKKEANIALKEKTDQLSNVTNNLNSVIYEFVLHKDGTQELTFMSKGAQELYGYSREQVLDDVNLLFEQVHPDDVASLDAAIQESAAKLSTYDHTFRYIMPSSGKIKFLRGRGTPKKDGDKVVWTTISMDETDKELIKRSNKVLINEIHHRVKNNLAIISGLLQLEMFEIKDEMAILPMQRSINRIKSIAKVHEQLYKNDNLTDINIKEYLLQLVDYIQNAFSNHRNISIGMNVQDIQINVNEAIPLGMLFNELFTNSFKYAFNGEGGEINITMKALDDYHEVIYHDNGKGFREDFSFEDSKTLGMKVIHTLLDQLQADYDCSTENQFRLHLKYKSRMKGAHSNI